MRYTLLLSITPCMSLTPDISVETTNQTESEDNSPMSVLTSEAVVLRTWPVHESDLLVSFFTRDYGRLKGMAKAALKSRKRFGGALEPMTLTRAWFAERPRQELVRLDQLEILRSPLSTAVDQTRMAVLSFYAEVIDEALPERDPQATVFRLLASVLEQTSAVESEIVQPWMALTYFSLWMTRLMGLLPDIGHCMVCGDSLGTGEVRFNAYADGLFCGLHANGKRERAFGRFLATGAADAAGAGGEFCRRGVAAKARAGSAAVHGADAGAAFGAQAEDGGGAGEAGRLRPGLRIRACSVWMQCVF
jgi:DNA repair protein RecO (recombination protein O)